MVATPAKYTLHGCLQRHERRDLGLLREIEILLVGLRPGRNAAAVTVALPSGTAVSAAAESVAPPERGRQTSWMRLNQEVPTGTLLIFVTDTMPFVAAVPTVPAPAPATAPAGVLLRKCMRLVPGATCTQHDTVPVTLPVAMASTA